jgi:mannose-6-phosphate isomerase-like protein (cupin superfamily)
MRDMGANVWITRLAASLPEDEVSRQSRNFFKGSHVGAMCMNSCDHGTYLTNGEVRIHVHDAAEEVFYFIRGAGVVVLGDKEIPVRAGSTIAVPAGVPHGVRNTGKDILQHIVCSAGIRKEG